MYWSEYSVCLQILCFELDVEFCTQKCVLLQIFCVPHRNEAHAVSQFKSIMRVSPLVLLSWYHNQYEDEDKDDDTGE